MRFPDLFRLALRNSLRSGIKSLLCVGAVCIGICSVCTVRGIGSAAEQAVCTELDELGLGGTVFFASGVFDVSEAVGVATQVEGVNAAMPFLYCSGNIKLRNSRMNAAACGVNERLAEVLSVKLQYGRLISKNDVRDSAFCAVIDEQTALDVYHRGNIVGKTLQLTIDGNTVDCEIVGVIRSQKAGLEALLGGSLPCILYVPHTTLSLLAEKGESTMFALSAKPDLEVETVNNAVAASLSHTLSVNYQHENLDRYTDSFRTVTETVSLLVSGIAAISILVGGIGLMNSMVAVVDARVGEIGVWLALGAKRSSVAWCYILEALLICLSGGAAGVALSAIGLTVVGRTIGVSLSLGIVDMIVGIAGAAVCGMLFGGLPALRAARMNPIQAIQSE